MRVIPIEVTDDTISHGEAYQWDEVVRIDFVAVDEIFTEGTSVHAVKGRLSQYLQPEYVSSREIYVDLPAWLFESAAENAMVYAYDHGSTVAAASIRITPRGGLPLQDETIDGLVAYRINLNMVPTGLAPLTISVSRFDKNSRVIRARMINGDAVYEVPDSASAMLLMTKADGFGIEIPCTVSNGYVYATLTEQACAAEGPAKAEIRITESGRMLGSANFVILVEPAALDEDTVISDSDIPAIEQAIAAAGQAENAAGRAATYADRAQATYDNFAEVVAEQVEQMQIREGQTVIDGTLTVSGAAADAKAAGDRIRAIETAFDSKAPIIINSASGAIAAIADGADDMPMESVAVNIEPNQSGSGDPSPDNVRPISGWTGAKVTRAGKNLLPNVKYQATATSVRLGNSNEYSLYLPKGTYTLSVEYLNDNHPGAFYRFQSDAAPRNIWATASTATSGTLTIDKDEPFTLWLYKSDSFSVEDVGNFWLELGSTATAYEPYTAQTYSITFPSEAGTVYGGTLDVTKGTLTVDVAYKSFNSADMNNSENYPGWKNAGIADLGYAGVTSGLNVMCSVGSWIAYNASSDVIYMPRAKYSNMTQTEWIALGVDVQMLIPLLTPITYTLTPTEIRTLLGVNNVWADAGAVNVEYPADTKLYIEQLTKPTEDDMVANAAIQSGKFFMVGNRLFLATSAIASGDTINPGTNCTELSLADALNRLN